MPQAGQLTRPSTRPLAGGGRDSRTRRTPPGGRRLLQRPGWAAAGSPGPSPPWSSPGASSRPS